ncbi:MAG: hypothetical protein RIF33_12840 [Cyclobacteriaceae bacterium]
MSKKLIICGMHRSGTSLITQWLQACGLPIGDRLLDGDQSNFDGHFEDLDFLNFNTGLLKKNGLSWQGYSHKFVLHYQPEHCETIKKIVERKSRIYPQFGWKDPRNCLVLPLYASLTEEFDYFFIYRHYSEVTTSLLNREIREERKSEFSKGLIGKARFLWNNMQKERAIYQPRLTIFQNCWLDYNSKILDHYTRYGGLLFGLDFILQNDRLVFDMLVKRGYDLNYIEIKEFYNDSLMNRKTIIPLTNSSVTEADELLQLLDSHAISK